MRPALRYLNGAALGVMAAALCGLPQTASAAGGGGDVPGYIFHHVTDSNYYEFELPLWVPQDEQAAALALPTIMIPAKDGATCGPLLSGFRVLSEAELQVASQVQRPGWGDGCLDLSPTKNVLMMVIGSVLLLLVFLLGSHRNKGELVPRGRLANFLEMMVVFVRDELAIKNIGEKEGPRYVPYLLSVFFFILFLNMLGLVPFMATATSAIGTTVTLATLTFILTQVASIRAAGLGGYLKHLTGGVHWALWPIMVPVEIAGLFTKPFALTMRLFANMLAGHIVLFFLISLTFIMGGVAWAGLAVPFAFAIYLLEIFVSFLQAYIFTMLSALFIGMGVAMGHHDDHHPEVPGAQPEGAHSHDHGKAQPLSG